MAWRRNLQVSSVGTSAERLGVGADHDGGRAAGAKGAATEETRKGLRLRILPGTGCHRAGPPSKSGARAGGGRSDDFTQSNCGGTEAELATSATTCLHPQPPSRAYICVRNLFSLVACRARSKSRRCCSSASRSCSSFTDASACWRAASSRSRSIRMRAPASAASITEVCAHNAAVQQTKPSPSSSLMAFPFAAHWTTEVELCQGSRAEENVLTRSPTPNRKEDVSRTRLR